MSASRSVVDSPLVRAVHGAVRVDGLAAPHDTVHLRLFHPARATGSDAERLTGQLPPDPTRAPWPVVVLLPGINVGPEGTRWLAEALGAAGIATVTYALVGETLPGTIGISPGLDLDACRPERYGSAPTATAVGPILDELARLAAAGPLAGMLDLDHVVLGGYSAGGTVALQSASPDWFPGVVGAFSYAGHTMASTFLGYPPETVLSPPAPLPTLLLGAELDGVVAASSDRYGTGGDHHDPVRRTFEVAAAGGAAPAWWGVLRGATHASFLWPADPTSARGFLDPPAGRDPAEIRRSIAAALTAFVDAVAGTDAAAPGRLDAVLADPDAFVTWERA